MFEVIQAIMYGFSNILLWPVCILLILGAVHTLYMFGGLVVEAFQRRGEAKALADPLPPPPTMARRLGMARCCCSWPACCHC